MATSPDRRTYALTSSHTTGIGLLPLQTLLLQTLLVHDSSCTLLSIHRYVRGRPAAPDFLRSLHSRSSVKCPFSRRRRKVTRRIYSPVLNSASWNLIVLRPSCRS